MNLIFLSGFEKQNEQGGVVSAQLSVVEELGEWRVWWHEADREGMPVQESWYAGSGWDGMLAGLRERLADKRRDGFRPVIELSAERETGGTGRWLFLRKLEYYGERHADEQLYEALRRWRNGQAANEGKSPFILASNRLLKMISAFLPHTIEELRQIPGLGEHKAGLYGADILALTEGKERKTTFPLDWVDGAVDGAETEQWVRERQERRSQSESAKQELKRKLLDAVRQGLDLDTMEPIFSLSRRELVSRIEELDKEGCDLEPLIAAELSAVPQPLLDKAWSEFASSGDRFLRPVLQRLYDEKSLDEQALGRAYEWLRLLRLRFRRTRLAIAELTDNMDSMDSMDITDSMNSMAGMDGQQLPDQSA